MATPHDGTTYGQGEELRWRQPELTKRYYELMPEGGESPLATLEWRSAWGTLATAQTGVGTWTFKRTGFLHPLITVRRAGSEEDLAIFEANWQGSGTLTFAGGGRYAWKSANFWHSQWSWLAADGTELLHFANRQMFVRHEANVEIASAAARLPKRDLLATLGWYLLILSASDSATTAAITASV